MTHYSQTNYQGIQGWSNQLEMWVNVTDSNGNRQACFIQLTTSILVP